MSQTSKHIILLLLLLTNSVTIWAQHSDYDLIKVGNKNFKQKNYQEAETNYQKAANKRATLESYFNLGNAIIQQGQDSVAMANFMIADSLASPNKKKMASVRHNIGNVYFAQASGKLEQNDKAQALQFFQKAVNAYKASLRKNPNDNETRHNLAKAQYWVKKLSEEQQNQQQDKNKQNQDKKDQQDKDKQNKDQQNKDDKNKDQKDKDKKDQDKKDQDQKDKDKQDQNKDDQDKNQQNKDQKKQGNDSQKNQQDQQQKGQQPNQPREGQIDQETAKKLLDAAQQDEKRIQRRLKEQNKDPLNAGGTRKRKDW